MQILYDREESDHQMEMPSLNSSPQSSFCQYLTGCLRSLDALLFISFFPLFRNSK